MSTPTTTEVSNRYVAGGSTLGIPVRVLAEHDDFERWYEAARKDARRQVIEWLESRNRAATGLEFAQEARARFDIRNSGD